MLLRSPYLRRFGHCHPRKALPLSTSISSSYSPRPTSSIDPIFAPTMPSQDLPNCDPSVTTTSPPASTPSTNKAQATDTSGLPSRSLRYVDVGWDTGSPSPPGAKKCKLTGAPDWHKPQRSGVSRHISRETSTRR